MHSNGTLLITTCRYKPRWVVRGFMNIIYMRFDHDARYASTNLYISGYGIHGCFYTACISSSTTSSRLSEFFPCTCCMDTCSRWEHSLFETCIWISSHNRRLPWCEIPRRGCTLAYNECKHAMICVKFFRQIKSWSLVLSAGCKSASLHNPHLCASGPCFLRICLCCLHIGQIFGEDYTVGSHAYTFKNCATCWVPDSVVTLKIWNLHVRKQYLPSNFASLLFHTPLSKYVLWRRGFTPSGLVCNLPCLLTKLDWHNILKPIKQSTLLIRNRVFCNHSCRSRKQLVCLDADLLSWFAQVQSIVRAQCVDAENIAVADFCEGALPLYHCLR